MKKVHFLFVLSLLVLFSVPAVAQDLSAMVQSAAGSTATLQLENTYEYPVKVVNIRLMFENPDGSQEFVYSSDGWSVDLTPEQTWTGEVSFDGASEFDLASFDGISTAAGYPISEIVEPAEAAMEGTEMAAIAEQLTIVRGRIPPISRAVRFHGDHLDGAPVPRADYFDLERLDALKLALEDAICEVASGRIVSAYNNTARQTVYEELGPQLREYGLHITCINSEAKLSAARMLIAGDRPQDALLFKETDEDGNLLPEWEPIYLEASLALARTAAELEVTAFNSLKPALEALNNAYELAPENEEVLEVAQMLVPAVAGWVQRACGDMNRDLDAAYEALEMLMPNWGEMEVVQTAAQVYATELVEVGLGFCERREYVNARNRFVRGERLLQGIPAWDENAESINLCRARGALAEGLETASLSTDPDAPGNGYEQLEIALERYDLDQSEVDEFKVGISDAYVDVALVLLDEFNFAGASHAIRRAEEVHPEGESEKIGGGWLTYAEKRYERGGIFMSGVDLDDASDALERAGDVDPDRASAIASKLTLARYGYKAGIPIVLLLGGLAAWLFRMQQKRKGRQFEDLADEDF